MLLKIPWHAHKTSFLAKCKLFSFHFTLTLLCAFAALYLCACVCVCVALFIFVFLFLLFFFVCFEGYIFFGLVFGGTRVLNI